MTRPNLYHSHQTSSCLAPGSLKYLFYSSKCYSNFDFEVLSIGFVYLNLLSLSQGFFLIVFLYSLILIIKVQFYYLDFIRLLFSIFSIHLILPIYLYWFIIYSSEFYNSFAILIKIKNIFFKISLPYSTSTFPFLLFSINIWITAFYFDLKINYLMECSFIKAYYHIQWKYEYFQKKLKIFLNDQ